MPGFSLPTVGQPNSTEDAKILTALTGLNDLAGGYRTLASATSATVGAMPAGTYLFGQSVLASGGLVVSGGAATSSGIPPLLHLTSADHAVTGLTTTLQLHAAVLANATQPTITFTFGLYPLSVAGAANALTLTTGTVVSGSTVAIASPSASTVTRGTPATGIALPANGIYALGVATSATLTANNASLLSAQLQLHTA